MHLCLYWILILILLIVWYHHQSKQSKSISKFYFLPSGNPTVPMNDECLAGIPCLGEPQPLSGQLSVPVDDRRCSVSHGNWMKPKKRYPLYDCSLLIWRISSVNQREVCPPYYHISTSTYQFRCSLLSPLSSHRAVPLNKSMISF